MGRVLGMLLRTSIFLCNGVVFCYPGSRHHSILLFIEAMPVYIPFLTLMSPAHRQVEQGCIFNASRHLRRRCCSSSIAVDLFVSGRWRVVRLWINMLCSFEMELSLTQLQCTLLRGNRSGSTALCQKSLGPAQHKTLIGKLSVSAEWTPTKGAHR